MIIKKSSFPSEITEIVSCIFLLSYTRTYGIGIVYVLSFAYIYTFEKKTTIAHMYVKCVTMLIKQMPHHGASYFIRAIAVRSRTIIL